jgi:hypothetical protein
MGLFSRSSTKEQLQKKYAKLMEESFHLSKVNRKASDEKVAEAEVVLKQIEAMN